MTLEELSKEVVKLLGGNLDPISAVQQLDSVLYLGNVRRTLLQIHALIPVAYPTLTAKADKEQMCLLHLLKLLPHSFKHELAKAGVTTLELAVTTVEGMERANRVMGEQTGLNRVVTQPDARAKVEYEDKTSPCFVCGLSDHWRAMCPFRQDICGRCEKKRPPQCHVQRDWSEQKPGKLQLVRQGAGAGQRARNCPNSCPAAKTAAALSAVAATAAAAAVTAAPSAVATTAAVTAAPSAEAATAAATRAADGTSSAGGDASSELSLHQPNSSTSKLSNVSTRPVCRYSCAEPGSDSSCRYRGRHNCCAPGPSPSGHTHPASW